MTTVERMRALIADEAVQRRIEVVQQELGGRYFNVLRDSRVRHPRLQPEFWSVHLSFAFLDQVRSGPDAGTVHEMLVSPLTDPEVPTGRGTALDGGPDGWHVLTHGRHAVLYEVRPRTRIGRVVAPLLVHTWPDADAEPDRRVPLRAGRSFTAPDGVLSDVHPTVESVADLLAGYGPEDADLLRSALVPAVRLQTGGPGPAAGVTSRLGGLPDLPPSAAWPRGRRGALTFLGQIRLDELAGLPAARDLPAGGLLSFFWDELALDDLDGSASRVLFHDDVDALARRQLPDDLATLSSAHDPRWRLFAERRVRLLPTLTVPEDVTLPDGYVPTPLGITLGTGHRLLGEPCSVQAELVDCLPEDHRADRGRWRLLLQLHGEEPFMAVHEGAHAWGCTHAVYVMLREQDLAERMFDRAVLHAQPL